MNRIINLVLIIVLLLTFVVPLAAQVDTETPTDEPTLEPTAEVTQEPVTTPPDVTPVGDEVSAGVTAFLTQAGLIMGILAYFVIQGAKYVFPDTVIETRQIYLVVTGLFAAVYVAASIFGLTNELSAGVDFLTAMADPLWQLILLFGGSAFVFKGFEALGVPYAGDAQGNKAFSLEPQR